MTPLLQLLASTTSTRSPDDAFDLCAILAKLPADSASRALSARILSYPPSATPYAHADDRFLVLAAELQHDPRSLVVAHFGLLDARPFELPASGAFGPIDGRRQKALMAAAREWAVQAHSLPDGPPESVDQARWDALLATAVDRLVALALVRSPCSTVSSARPARRLSDPTAACPPSRSSRSSTCRSRPSSSSSAYSSSSSTPFVSVLSRCRSSGRLS